MSDLWRFTTEPGLLERFIELPYRLYASDPRWVPPLRSALRRRLLPSAPYFQHARHQNFLLVQGRRSVARCSAFLDEHQEDEGRPVGLVGLFESVRDPAAAVEVLEAATTWLREQGAVHVLGPVDFSIWYAYRLRLGDPGGATFMGEPYNPPWYPDQFEAAGFEKEWVYKATFHGPSQMRAIAERMRPDYEAVRRAGFRFRPYDPRRFDRDLKLVYARIVSGFRDFPGWTDVGIEEFLATYRSFGLVYDPALFAFVESGEETVAIGVALPDEAKALRAMRGRGGPLSTARFLWKRRRRERMLLSYAAVREDHRGKRLGNASMCAAILAGIDRGYKELMIGLSKLDNLSTRFRGDAEGETRHYALFKRPL